MGFYPRTSAKIPSSKNVPRTVEACGHAAGPASGDLPPENRVWIFSDTYPLLSWLDPHSAQCLQWENSPSATAIASGLSVWPNRDPIGENGGENLYGFVWNSSLDWFDVLGGYPLQGAIGGFREAKNEGEKRRQEKERKQRAEAQKRFDDWFEKETKRMEENDWTQEIIDEGKLCPQSLTKNSGGGFNNPEQKKWENPADMTKGFKGAIVGTKYHPGGKYEMRSLPTKSGHGNQCIYDCNGKLISGNNAAAGSADYVAPEGKYSKGHIKHDVDPFHDANIADSGDKYPKPGKMTKNVEKYYTVRPQLNHEN